MYLWLKTKRLASFTIIYNLVFVLDSGFTELVGKIHLKIDGPQVTHREESLKGSYEMNAIRQPS